MAHLTHLRTGLRDAPAAHLDIHDRVGGHITTRSVLARPAPAVSAMLLAALSLSLCACNTPKEALEQANHSAKLMSQLQIQLDQFRSTVDAADAARLASMAAQREVLERGEMSLRLRTTVKKAAGDTVEIPMMEKLMATADFIGGMEPALTQSKKADQAKFATLLAPLPSTTADINATQAAASKMGTELPLKVRATEFVSAAKDVKDAVKQDMQALEDAKLKAASTDKTVATAVAKAASAAEVAASFPGK